MTSHRELHWDRDGLIPAIVQDASSGEVLTLAYVNRESLERTLSSGETVFFSRSRGQLWHKGETSGNVQKVISVKADCDQDALVIAVDPAGPACHTGARSCFFEEVAGFSRSGRASIGPVLAELQGVVRDRRERRPEGSYTARLFGRGRGKILQKLGEEAVETVVAGMSGNREEMVREAADLLYHLVVALQDMGVSLDEVAAELSARRK